MTMFDPEGRIAFEPTGHAYRLDGHPVLGVTQAIGLAMGGLLGERFWRSEHRERGSAVHAAIMLHAERDLDETSVHPIVQPYFDAFLRFLEVEQFEFLCSEQQVFDAEYRYCGTLDGVGWLRGPRRPNPVPGIEVIDQIDWKSGSLPWTVGMQTAAYVRAIRPALPKTLIRRWALQLRGDGTYFLDCVSSWPDARQHEADFLACVRVAALRQAHEVL